MRLIQAISIVFLLVSSQLGVTSIAGEIRGTANLGTANDKVPARYVVRGQGAKSQTSNSSGAIAIALENLGGNLSPAVADTPLVMAQENTAFVPNLLVVPLGSQVTFPNRDAFFHNVFSLSRPRTFDLGRYPQGESKSVEFDRPGAVQVFCHIHSDMSAVVFVTPSAFFTSPTAGGTYEIRGIPAGTSSAASTRPATPTSRGGCDRPRRRTGREACRGVGP